MPTRGDLVQGEMAYENRTGLTIPERVDQEIEIEQDALDLLAER